MSAQLTNPLSSGYRTSEFATTIGSSAGIGLLAMGIVSTDQVDPVSQLVTTAIAGAAAIFTIGWIVVSFIQGRRDIKQLLIEKGIIGEIPVEVQPTPVEEVPAQG